ARRSAPCSTRTSEETAHDLSRADRLLVGLSRPGASGGATTGLRGAPASVSGVRPLPGDVPPDRPYQPPGVRGARGAVRGAARATGASDPHGGSRGREEKMTAPVSLRQTVLLVVDAQRGFSMLCPDELPVPGGVVR